MGRLIELNTPFHDTAIEDLAYGLTDDGSVSRVSSVTATLDFPSIAANASSDLTVTVADAALNDVVSVGAPNLVAGIGITAFVSAANTVTVRAENNSIGAINPVAQTYRVMVTHFG